MKVKLLVDVPVGSEHGLIKGRVLETCDSPPDKLHLIDATWVMGDIGIPVRVFFREYEKVEE
jgi:hypothetical protein